MKKISSIMSAVLIFTVMLGNSAKAQKKWSPEAKNTVIGAGAGAIVGAVVSKHNKPVGALIGAGVGGGAGYLYGRHRHRVLNERAATQARLARQREESNRVEKVVVYKPAPAPVYQGYHATSQVAMSNSAYATQDGNGNSTNYIRTKSW